ncbi:methyltransferase domain-containing protein [Mycobacterium persicum]|uniref:Methyltransferase n=1 Tax=Mycobacterium persicum TaxID=1487726 RepID=A0A1X0L4R8_9MYCO|nr:methyltransferase domain-containing protein [Mycobacterium persicum]KZS85825.1 hypothetical protein A4G31_03740 [Mycobacterium persicum]ORC05977.1 hypothetical protein B4U45_04275 [Mycobacterium persicum]VAZ77283.1 putative methyltransferase [Mycobacterium persicum]VAZ84655.1 putative methyltransferase [Mycobacterium persicum]VAZ96210.1 putative methyltransferase [Mycobacterium persicum]
MRSVPLLAPLAAHLVPTAVIGYGFVLPAAGIAAFGAVGVGFGMSLVGTVLAYFAGVRMAHNTTHSASWIAGVLSRQAAAPHGVLGRLLGRIWVSETKAVNAAAIDLLAPQVHEHVLEIGFGPGRTVQLLSQRAAKVIGIEVSGTMLTAARRRNAQAIQEGRVELVRGNGITLPLPTSCVDAVVGVHTVYFWSQPDTTLAEIARVLRPRGRVVLAFRDGDSAAPRRFDLGVYRLYRANDLARMLRQVGFTDIETRQLTGESGHVSCVRARSY